MSGVPGGDGGGVRARSRPQQFAHQSVWVEGTPEPSLWAGIKTRGRRLLSTVTYRCPTCGLLQSYARQEYVDFI